METEEHFNTVKNQRSNKLNPSTLEKQCNLEYMPNGYYVFDLKEKKKTEEEPKMTKELDFDKPLETKSGRYHVKVLSKEGTGRHPIVVKLTNKISNDDTYIKSYTNKGTLDTYSSSSLDLVQKKTKIKGYINIYQAYEKKYFGGNIHDSLCSAQKTNSVRTNVARLFIEFEEGEGLDD